MYLAETAEAKEIYLKIFAPGLIKCSRIIKGIVRIMEGICPGPKF